MNYKLVIDGYSSLNALSGRKMAPLVSILIPTYNREKLIEQTLVSIQRQSYSNWEAIILDDISTDSTVERISSFCKSDTRFRMFSRKSRHRGANVCRNEAFTQSFGEYVIFLDSDDLLATHCISQRVKAFRDSPNCDFIVSPTFLFDKDPGDTDILFNKNGKEGSALDRFMMLDIPWQTAGPTWRREAVVALNGWDGNLPSWQDIDFHIRAVLADLDYKWLAVPDTYHRRPGSGRESISTHTCSDLHLNAHAKWLLKLQEELDARGLLSDTRARMLAGLYFWHLSGRTPKTPDLTALTSFWRLCRSRKLVSQKQYTEGYVFAQLVSRSRLAAKLYIRYLRLFWPTELTLPAFS